MSIRLTIFCIFAIVLGQCITARAQTVQPVYTRPSKGASLTVFDANFPAAGASQTSAVYDMTAFAEIQFTARVSFSDLSVTNESYGISGFGRYVKILAEYDFTGPSTSIVYTLLGSDSPTGSFTEIGGVGGRQVVMPKNGGNITNAKLIMTPLPYETIQYTRPGKGLPIVVLNKRFGSSLSYPNTPSIDMKGFASFSVTVDYALPSGSTWTTTACRYTINNVVYGGDSADQNKMRILTSPAASRYAGEDVSYAVDVITNYAFIGGTVVDGGAGSGDDCTVYVGVTPLPFSASPSVSKVTTSEVGVATLDALGTPSKIALSDRRQTTRLQVLGAGAVACGRSSAGLRPIELVAETVAGNGGVFTLTNYVGDLYCNSVGGTATQLGIFSY